MSLWSLLVRAHAWATKIAIDLLPSLFAEEQGLDKFMRRILLDDPGA
jgi:hypothetical protein